MNRKKSNTYIPFSKTTLQLAVATIGVVATAMASAAKPHSAIHIAAVSVTGPNSICSQPIWELPAPFPSTLNFTLIGEYNPATSAKDALLLTGQNCRAKTVLATTTNPDFQAYFSFPDADSRLKNIRYRDVQVISGFFDGVRHSLPKQNAVEANPVPPSRSEPSYTITLGDWMSAEGEMKIKCDTSGGSEIKMKFSHLIPNGMYGLYGIWKTRVANSDSETFLPVAFGGFPHMIIPDSRGNAEFERSLNYCPGDLSADGSQLLFVNLAYHIDGHNYGPFPFITFSDRTFTDDDGTQFESSLQAGVIIAPQLAFPITVKPLADTSAHPYQD